MRMSQASLEISSSSTKALARCVILREALSLAGYGSLQQDRRCNVTTRRPRMRLTSIPVNGSF
jgi:hypothetical protein